MSAPRRILIVDDQPDLRKLIRMTLELGDFELHEAMDGAGALRQAVALRPDLVLLDVMMPGKTGFEVCQAVRADETLAATRILMLTSEASVEAEAEGLAAGADDYILKPVEPRRLAARVKALRARSHDAPARS